MSTEVEKIETKKVPTAGKKCFQCGKEQDIVDYESVAPAMKRCSRCHLAVYCSKECQIIHWREGHKKVCGIETHSSRIPWVFPNTQPMKADPNKFELMNFMVATPPAEDVSGCCAFCAMITKKEGDNRMYFIPELIDCDLMAAYAEGNEPYPANYLRVFQDIMDFPPYPPPKDNYTRKGYASGPNGIPPAQNFVGCCCRCANRIGRCSTQNDPVFIRHFLACSNMLMLVRKKQQLDKFRRLSMLNPTWMERRVVAAITLYSRPDLSKGKASFAGEYSKASSVESDGKEKKSKGKVTYNFVDLEAMAFPDLFPCAIGMWKEDCGIDLGHYTLARLNSISSKWRKSPDYVMFSVHRLIAYGLMKQSEVNALYEDRGEGFLVDHERFLSMSP